VHELLFGQDITTTFRKNHQTWWATQTDRTICFVGKW
jgi:hypothetical protein